MDMTNCKEYNGIIKGKGVLYMVNVFLVLILIFVNIPLYKKIFYYIFEDVEDFRESLRFSFTPDMFSLFRREYVRDQVGEFKLGGFFISCIFVVGFEFFILGSIFNLF